MKKIGFLFFGIVLVFVILSLHNFEGVSSYVKRIFLEVAQDVEDILIETYYDISSFVTEVEGI